MKQYQFNERFATVADRLNLTLNTQLVLKIYVKFMVGIRCSEKLREELGKLGILMPEINQGVVEFQNQLTEKQLLRLKDAFFKLGLEVLDAVNSKLLDRISELIQVLIRKKPELAIADYPGYLEEKLGFDDSEMKVVFPQVYGITLLQYIAVKKVELIKEMILYEDRSLGEIAEMLHFKNGAQLTRVFQKVTGLVPSYYKQIRKKRLDVRKSSGFG